MELTNSFDSIRAVVVVIIELLLPERSATRVVLRVATGCLSVSQLQAVAGGGTRVTVCGRL